MKREDVVGKPKLFVEREGSLAHTSACCLAIMIDGMPHVYEEARPRNPRHGFQYPLEKRHELLAWLEEQKSFRFKPFNYYRTPRGEIRKKGGTDGFSDENLAEMYWTTMSFCTQRIFGVKCQPK